MASQGQLGFAKVVFTLGRTYVKRLSSEELREMLRARKETPLILSYAIEELSAREQQDKPTDPCRIIQGGNSASR